MLHMPQHSQHHAVEQCDKAFSLSLGARVAEVGDAMPRQETWGPRNIMAGKEADAGIDTA